MKAYAPVWRAGVSPACICIKNTVERPRKMPPPVIKIEDDGEPRGERERERERDAGSAEHERARAMWASLEGLVRCLEALVDPPAAAEPAIRKRRRP